MDVPLDIVRRKERLIARCAAQRDSFAASLRTLAQPIGIVDRGLALAGFLRAHPVLVAGAVAVIVAFRKRNLPLALGARAFMAWRTWRKLTAWVERLGLDVVRGYGSGKG